MVFRLFLLLSLLCGLALADDEFVLVHNGQAVCFISLGEGAKEDEQLAARELQAHVKLMTDAELGTVKAAGLKPIELSVDPNLLEKFRLEVTEDRLRIIGRDGEGSLFGAYEVLEQLGVRWYFPGEAGRIYPRNSRLAVRAQTTSQTPSFKARHLQGGLSMDKKSWEEWLRRMRCGGPFFPSAHGLKLSQEQLDSDPNLRALVRGRRVGKQICVTHPRAVGLVVEKVRAYFRKHPDREWIGLGPSDGRGFCECDDCAALDTEEYDRHSKSKPLTDRYIWFLNQIADGIAEEFPEKKIGFYAYAAMARPPVRFKPHPRLVPAIAPINYCRIHGVDHPLCVESREVLELWKGWKALSPEVYHRGYWFNLADPGLMFPMVHRIRREIPLAKSVGLEGFRVECTHPWASQLPSLYVACRLMWNDQANVDAILDEFFRTYYGPEAAPMMKEAFGRFETALDEARFHTGSCWDFPQIYLEVVFEETDLLYQEALRVADPEQKTRIGWTRGASTLTRDFVAMLNARNRHDWDQAMERLLRVRETIEELTTIEPPMLSRRYAARFLDRFFAPATEQGYLLESQQEPLFQFDSSWRFRADPDLVGINEGWPQQSHQDWPEILTSRSWGSQGLRYLKGAGWYETDFTATSPQADKKTYLWFSGVDERADIWLNGEQVARGAGGAFKPFEVEVTGPLLDNNRLTVRVVNISLNELGTGGILGPVILYQRY